MFSSCSDRTFGAQIGPRFCSQVLEERQTPAQAGVGFVAVGALCASVNCGHQKKTPPLQVPEAALSYPGKLHRRNFVSGGSFTALYSTKYNVW